MEENKVTTMTDNAENLRPARVSAAAGQAKAQLENIQAMMERLTHAQECSDWQTCACTRENHSSMLEFVFEAPSGTTRLFTEEELEQYHDEDEARQRIDEDPLSVMVRSDWVESGVEMKPAEYEILLMTGGPAVRIIGSLDEHGEPDRARLQYQDWGTPWTELFNPRDPETLIAYAGNFFYT